MAPPEFPREVTKPVWDVTPGYDFDPDVDLKEVPSWFLDGAHSIPAWTPMFTWFWNRYCCHGQKYAAELLCTPNSKGWQMRTYHGHDYCSFLIVRDPEEIKQREVKFREALRPFIEDFDKIWYGYVDEMFAFYKPLREFDYDNAKNSELLYRLYDVIKMYRRMWEIHFTCQFASYNTWVLLDRLCREKFGIGDTSPEFQKLMVGFDNKVFQVNKRLWQFGQEAQKRGLADIILNNEARAVIPKLEQSEAGREWVKELREWLWEDGWRVDRPAEINVPTWIEDPTPAIQGVKGFLAKGGGFDLDETRERLANEREEAVAALVQRMPEDQRGWFEALIRLAQKTSFWAEEHDHYLDLYCHALIRFCCLGIGRRLTQAGTVDQPEDVFYLNPDEVERVMLAPDCHKLHYIVNRRRKEWEGWISEDPPPVITTRASIQEAVGEDIIPSADGVALKVVVGEMPEIKPELKADLYGLCGAPGIAEGPARVVLTYEQMGQVKPGEILVAPTTGPSWTPVFGIIKGAVVDRGGTLSHASIVGREHGIPAVINTFEGTKKIKTGQRIRVDGYQGTVHILE
jgi:pyruvate,water dikinase